MHSGCSEVERSPDASTLSSSLAAKRAASHCQQDNIRAVHYRLPDLGFHWVAAVLTMATAPTAASAAHLIVTVALTDSLYVLRPAALPSDASTTMLDSGLRTSLQGLPPTAPCSRVYYLRQISSMSMPEAILYLWMGLRLCMYFSNKPYNMFMEFGGYSAFLERNPMGGWLKFCVIVHLLKPTFTVVRDKGTKCFLPFIRGAISVRQWLTVTTGVEIPFHHVAVQEDHVSNLVLGYAHCGMVIPCLSKAVKECSDYGISRGMEKSAWDASGECLALLLKNGNKMYCGLLAVYDVALMHPDQPWQP
ncbi:hypothetical protein EJB05_28558, partial [Eragrostis curvula]